MDNLKQQSLINIQRVTQAGEETHIGHLDISNYVNNGPHEHNQTRKKLCHGEHEGRKTTKHEHQSDNYIVFYYITFKYFSLFLCCILYIIVYFIMNIINNWPKKVYYIL